MSQQVALKTAHGKYLVVEPDGTIKADRDTAGPWETFTLEGIGGGTVMNPVPIGKKISLKTHHGMYLSAQPDGKLEANRSAVGPWEEFEVVAVGPQ